MRKLLCILSIVLITSCSSSQKSKEAAKSVSSSIVTSPYSYRSIKSDADYFSSDIYGPFYVGDPDLKPSLRIAQILRINKSLKTFSSVTPLVILMHPPITLLFTTQTTL